ncbi:MAG: bifunctional [glutamine synthetase] adenylyltransferase/[glutamine synthetase]-adenylyl-L-tyrosine phosphorylase [Frankiaceae bacterium]
MGEVTGARIVTSRVRLLRLGFHEPERAESALRALGLPVPGDPNWPGDPLGRPDRLVAPRPDQPPTDETGADVVHELGRAADPDLALSSLARLGEVAPLPELISALRTDVAMRRRLVRVLGASSALGDHLVRHPDDWRALLSSANEERPERPDRALQDLRATLPPKADQGLEGLRAGYRRGQFLIAAADLTGASVDDVGVALAALADAALQAALALATRDPSISGELADGPVPLAVIGMGKCGGRELNYSSDVDVIFVTDRDEHLRVATRLAESVIRICAQPTASGTVFPVDAGLRPEGRAGPLVRTVASHEAYYRRWARTWEFQALLKARPVAGDPEIGGRFVATVEPLVWSAAGRADFVPDVRQMRRRVEGSLPRRSAERELKLGPGGLRDVEFAVQLLQLVHGRTDESLRSAATLRALAALAAGGYVGRPDAAGLARSYRFLRSAEHRLQLQRLRRTHTIPTDPAALRWLGRSLGFTSDPAEEFLAEHARHAREVRRLHEKLFYRPLLEAVARLPAEDIRLTPAQARSRLQALGFADPLAAFKHLEALTTGVSRTAAIQRTLLPAMLGWFADAADPDAGLLAYRQVSEALGRSPWYLRLLRDEGSAAQRLALLLASSPYVADLLTRAPEAVRMLSSTQELVPRDREAVSAAMLAIAARSDDWEGAVAAARSVRRVELVRVASADLLGLLDVHAAGRALTDAAGATLESALAVALRKLTTEYRRPLPMRIAVIAMGRLGGAELGYGSDADVLFVHDPVGDATDSEGAIAAHAVAEELRRLLILPAPDPALLVDAGLRPEGRQGPLTRSLASYAAYYRRWSLGWEAQALLRASPAAGDPEITSRFLELADEVRYPASFPASAVREVKRLKRRIELERVPRGVDRTLHLKFGPGGLMDVEWCAQLLALRHAARLPELRTPSTRQALVAAQHTGLLSTEELDVLLGAWTRATRARNALMLASGRPGDVLPGSGRPLARVARLLGYPADSSDELVTDLRTSGAAARAVADEVFAREGRDTVKTAGGEQT